MEDGTHDTFHVFCLTTARKRGQKCVEIKKTNFIRQSLGPKRVEFGIKRRKKMKGTCM